MKVILTADVYKHGVAGEVVNVADGFARNYLIPKNLAMKATPGALKSLEAMRATAEARRAALDNRLNDLARQINGVELFFGRRASPTGKLFGSVTTTDIAEALNEKTGIDINRRRISGSLPREVGTHMVPVRIGTDISPELKITIVREEEFASYMQKRAEAEAAAAAAAEAGETVAEEAADTVSEVEVEAAADTAETADASAE